MIIKDCIKKAIGYLGLDGAAETDFLDMARDVVAEICSDYYPLKRTETIVFREGVAAISTLNMPVVDVFAVRQGRINLPFRLKYDIIDVGLSGGFEVEYSYMPALGGLDAELPFSERISARVIGYGIAAEYSLLSSPEDAALFDKRYKDALRKATAQKSEKRVKTRRWL